MLTAPGSGGSARRLTTTSRVFTALLYEPVARMMTILVPMFASVLTPPGSTVVPVSALSAAW